MSDYKKSLNLPDTSFPMKANLTQREPEMLRWWEENNIYGTMLEASGSRGSFLVPPGWSIFSRYSSLARGSIVNTPIPSNAVSTRAQGRPALSRTFPEIATGRPCASRAAK